ncbi:MAG TPA: archease [Planctomycetota bacterium]|jgi:SHS2 domain-containing protein|nr:archease [Planctomycetota bacterium]
MAPGSYEVFEHGADYGVRGLGPTMEAAFENAARAMFSIAVENSSAVRPARRIPVSAVGSDAETLLVEWLNALLAAASLEGIVLGDCRARVAEGSVNGEAVGEPFDSSRHAGGTEVKGATYTLLRVAREGERFVAQCVVDV